MGKQKISTWCIEVFDAITPFLTKGSGSNLGDIFYGNFCDLYVSMCGSLETLVDPHTDFSRRFKSVRAIQSIDISVFHAESFAAMRDAITGSK